MYRTAPWFVFIEKHASPLIYWCMGLCDEYSRARCTATRPSNRLLMTSAQHKSQVFRSCCPERTLEACKWDVISTLVALLLYLCQLKNSPSRHPSNLGPLLATPARVPPLLFRLYICSLVLGLEQRAIWALLPASLGGPLHRKAASLQHLSGKIKDISVYPLNFSSRFPSLGLSFLPFLPLFLSFLPQNPPIR